MEKIMKCMENKRVQTEADIDESFFGEKITMVGGVVHAICRRPASQQKQ